MTERTAPPYFTTASHGGQAITNIDEGVVYHLYEGTGVFTFCPGEELCDGPATDWCHVRLVPESEWGPDDQGNSL